MNSTGSTIENVIENMKIITFSYDGYTRGVELPHYATLGEATQPHGDQVSNGSKSEQLPGWKNFKLKKIGHLSIDNNSSFSERSDYNPDNSNCSNITKSVRSYPSLGL